MRENGDNMVLTLTVWYLFLFWKPLYYVVMMVFNGLHPSGDATAYVDKLAAWMGDLIGLVLPTKL